MKAANPQIKTPLSNRLHLNIFIKKPSAGRRNNRWRVSRILDDPRLRFGHRRLVEFPLHHPDGKPDMDPRYQALIPRANRSRVCRRAKSPRKGVPQKRAILAGIRVDETNLQVNRLKTTD